MTQEELLSFRKRLGFTQSKLAKALGVQTITVYRWEKAMREIPSFLHLALRCLELEGGEPKIKKSYRSDDRKPSFRAKKIKKEGK
jgi:transcriptional regulator with XRE-family HTH domain